jgi:threonine dehydrogenase-like Zn-dependent dehydrogenase
VTRELCFVGPGKLEWREVAAPQIDGDGQALVRPIAVATCDLDALLIRGEAPMFGGGFAFGHESVGVVTPRSARESRRSRRATGWCRRFRFHAAVASDADAG